MKTLAIETSCDDTSVGIISYDNMTFNVEQLLSFSQIDIHQEYGGVVPELAYRSHADKIVRLLEELGGDSIKEQIDCISVTSHPGLPGALQIGVTTAHTLGAKRDKPVVEVNHIMGHVFSVLLERTMDVSRLPYICLTVSGGHNDIYLITESQDNGIDSSGGVSVGVDESQTHKFTDTQTRVHTHANTQAQGTRHKRQHLEVGQMIHVGPFSVTKIGQTIDDASGEAFDKVARMLGGPYPGGPRIGKMAEIGEEDERVELNASFLKADEYLFSFSGLKSQVGQLIENLEQQGHSLDGTLKANIARRFQEEVSHVLAKKLVQAAEEYDAKAVGVVGGVSANVRLRAYIDELAAKRHLSVGKIIYPAQFVYCTDNAAMIGVAGLLDYSYQPHYEGA